MLKIVVIINYISALTLLQGEGLNAKWVTTTSSLISFRVNFILQVGGLLYTSCSKPWSLSVQWGQSIHTHKIKILHVVLDRHQVVYLTESSSVRLRFGNKLKDSWV